MSEGGEGSVEVAGPRLALRVQHSRDLWTKAIQKLSVADQQHLDLHGSDQSTGLYALLEIVQSKQQVSVDKQWRYRRRNGEVVMLRDVFGKLVEWIKRFQAVGDTMMQYDPGYAALPWGCVRLLLQVAVNDMETYGAMIEGLESISRYIAKYAKVEEVYLHRGAVLQDHLEACITELYVAILTYLSKARAYYDRKSSVRLVRSIIQSPASVEKSHALVAVKAKQVDDLTQILDADFARKTTGFMFEGFRGLGARFDELDHRIGNLGSASVKEEVGRETLTTWLNAVTTDEELDRASGERTPNTCQWILERPTFQEWLSQDQERTMKLLWVRGSRGAGKTILCANVIKHLQLQYPSRVVFFFCTASHKAKQQPESIVRSWAMQAINQDPEVCKSAADIYHGKEHRSATSSDVWHILRKSCERHPSSYYVIDGFDECVDSNSDSNFMQGPDALEFLRRLIDAISGTSARVLILSRDDADLRSHLRDLMTLNAKQFLEYEISESDTREDIRAFSHHTVAQKLPRKSSDLKNEVAAEASRASGGMFLWVRLLKNRLDATENAKGLRNIVKTMPRELEQTYDAEMERIFSRTSTRAQAISMLRWVLYSQRPLTVREILEATVIDVEDRCSNYPKEDLPDTWEEHDAGDRVRRLCGSLLELQSPEEDLPSQYHTVHFVHFSVREYLSTQKNSLAISLDLADSALSHDLLAQTCLRLFDYEDFRNPPISKDRDIHDLYESYHFTKYAALHWPLHAQLVSTWSNRLEETIRDFFAPEGQKWTVWGRAFATESDKTPEWIPIKLPDEVSPDFYLALFGFSGELHHLHTQGHDIARFEEHEMPPLHAAAAMGHREVVKLFHTCGANLDVRDDNAWTPLHMAARYDRIEVVQYLLDAGVEVDGRTIWNSTPLHFAAKKGHSRIVDALVSHGAFIDALNVNGSSALSIATARGHLQTMERLLRQGADVKLRNLKGDTLLHDAALSGNYDLFMLVLQHTADIHATSEDGWTSLHFAAHGGDAGIVKYLLSQGISVDAATSDIEGQYADGTRSTGMNPLHIAAQAGRLEIVQTLVEHGAKMNPITEFGFTPLHIAARAGHCSVVRFLLSCEGIEKHICMKKGATALMLASENGHSETIELLVAESDLDLQDQDGWTALCYAVNRNQVEAVKILLRHGASTQCGTGRQENPMHVALERNIGLEMVQLLLESDKELLTTPNNRGELAVHIAAVENNVEALELFSNMQKDTLDALNLYGRTALHHAVAFHRVEAVRFLSHARPSLLRIRAHSGEMPHHLAISTKNPNDIRILQALLGCDPSLATVVDGDGFTPIHLAVLFGQTDAVRLLADLAARSESGIENDPDHFGGPIGHYALHHGEYKALQILFEWDECRHCRDSFGRTVMDWISLLKPTLSADLGFPTAQYQQTAPDVLQDIMCRSTVRIAKRALEAQELFKLSILGRLLLFLQQPEDAICCFQLQAPTNTETGLDHHVACDMCDAFPITGTRFVCTACPDIDLCSRCMLLYPGSDEMQFCKDHQFLEISQANPIGSGIADGEPLPDDVQTWLRGLIKRFDEPRQEAVQGQEESLGAATEAKIC